MKILLYISLIIKFLTISAIHFYWAFGGKRWANLAIPTKPNSDTPLFRPRMFETLVVAFGLLGFVCIVASNATALSDGVAIKNIIWGMAAIFLLRAIGDFRYAGFFKKIKDTPFGIMDTKYYSPLCLVIGVMLLLINIL